MPEKYEGETCSSCQYFYERQLKCRAKPTAANGPGFAVAYHSEPICDQFAPSLECRKVLALEKIAGCATVSPAGILSFSIWRLDGGA